MRGGYWPYVPSRCPSCMYFLGYEPERLDDSGGRLAGSCRHRRVMMELVVPDDRSELDYDDCAMYVPSRRASGVGGLR